MLLKKLRDRNELIPVTTDKYLLRSYVADILGETYLPRLLHVAEHITQVRVSELPAAFAMKAAHGSGWNRIVHDRELGQTEATALAKAWLSQSYYGKRKEWAYKTLTPRIVFEENLSEAGTPPPDYKLYVFNGTPRMIDVHMDRFGSHQRAFYSPDWEPYNFDSKYPRPARSISRPINLSEMLEVAGKLAQPFTFARVDLYNTSRGVLVGEITHYPAGGATRFNPSTIDLELGEVWRFDRPIDEKYLLH